MATTGPKLTIPHTVGAGAIVGQGNSPELWLLYTTEDASVPSPKWLDASVLARSVEIDSGRGTELADDDAATATISVTNTDRRFDPVVTSGIRPNNRWWVREQFSGETHDLFKGYASSYEQRWTLPNDAVTVVQCSDVFKLLARDNLPATSPVRDSYEDLISSDAPDGYWRMNEPVETNVQAATITEPNPLAGNSGTTVDQGGLRIAIPGPRRIRPRG